MELRPHNLLTTYFRDTTLSRPIPTSVQRCVFAGNEQNCRKSTEKNFSVEKAKNIYFSGTAIYCTFLPYTNFDIKKERKNERAADMGQASLSRSENSCS